MINQSIRSDILELFEEDIDISSPFHILGGFYTLEQKQTVDNLFGFRNANKCINFIVSICKGHSIDVSSSISGISSAKGTKLLHCFLAYCEKNNLPCFYKFRHFKYKRREYKELRGIRRKERITVNSLYKNSDEPKWLNYLILLRYKLTKPHCPFCKSENTHKAIGTPISVKFKCNKCKYYFSPIQGTIFEGTKLSLEKWFDFYSLLKEYPKISGRQLAATLNITQKTSCIIKPKVEYWINNNTFIT